MLTVIIPYYQRETGVLRRALASVAAQQPCGMPVEVIVVDDASPVAAEGEVLAAALPPSIAVRVLTQANGGPGAARNTGLQAATPGARYIAFLDSDDEWAPDHLLRAVAALEQGYDFFFADHFQLGQTVGAFARGGRIRPAEHLALAAAEAGLYGYRGDMFHQVLTGNVVGTSTVVFRRHGFEAERFRVEFRSMGEDYLFWMGLAVRGARVAFSARVAATYGHGVNVFAGSGWGTPGYLQRLHDDMRFRKTILGLFQLSAQQRAVVHHAIGEVRRSFAMALLHDLAHRRWPSAAVLSAHARLDPASFLMLPTVLLDRVVGRR